MAQSIAVLSESNKIIFWYNFVGVSGGAVFITGTAFGTALFMNAIFMSNHAQTGDGVRATESGTTAITKLSG